MARPKKKREFPKHLRGMKYFPHLEKFVAHLHSHHDHPNRQLHFDQYLAMLLLAFFNPAIESLRDLVLLSQTPLANRNLGFHFTSLTSVSDASRLFDPEPLRRIFLELSEAASALDGPRRPTSMPPELKILAADASFWKLLPRMTKELYAGPRTRAPKGQLKGFFVYDVERAVPVDAEFKLDKSSEGVALLKQLQPGAIYLLDRGYRAFNLFEGIVGVGSSLVARLSENYKYTLKSKRELSEADRNAGVISDEVVQLGAKENRMETPMRIVQARIVSPPPKNLDPKHKRGKHSGYPKDQPLVQEWILVTNRMDLDAAAVVQLYQYRWEIEIFFRWFKCVLECKHLFAESENGMQLQFYAALIATVLVVLYTGRKPNKRLWKVIQFYFQGWCDIDFVNEQLEFAKLTAK